jgi:hypothetical protein
LRINERGDELASRIAMRLVTVRELLRKLGESLLNPRETALKFQEFSTA